MANGGIVSSRYRLALSTTHSPESPADWMLPSRNTQTRRRTTSICWRVPVSQGEDFSSLTGDQDLPPSLETRSSCEGMDATESLSVRTTAIAC
jgi:hypothetical protein